MIFLLLTLFCMTLAALSAVRIVQVSGSDRPRRVWLYLLLLMVALLGTYENALLIDFRWL